MLIRSVKSIFHTSFRCSHWRASKVASVAEVKNYLVDMSEQRYYNNPFADFTSQEQQDIVNIRGNEIQPGFLNQVKEASEKLLKLLEENLSAVSSSDMSVYTGTSGIALLYLMLEERKNDSMYLYTAKEFMEAALSRLKNRDISFICGDAGPLAIGAVIYNKLNDEKNFNKCVKKLLSFMPRVVHLNSGLPDELLYGRAGYLYSLLFVNQHVPDTIPENVIKQVINAMIVSGQNLSLKEKRSVPLMYEWYEEYYLGGAHGISGIIYLLLQAKNYLSQEQLNLISATIDYLLTIRYPSGNFPSSLGSTTDKLVHWCHGAPGFVQMLSLAAKVYNNENYRKAALKCGEVVWTRGLLRKGYGICHGVAGNAYTFLNLYQETGDVQHLYRACKFAEWCTSTYNRKQSRSPDRPFSLFEGLAGTVYFLYDLQEPTCAKFPAFSV